MQTNDPSYLLTSIQELGLPPEYQAAVVRFVGSKLENSNQQIDAQDKAWKIQEAGMLEKIKELSAQVERTALFDLRDSPMPLDNSSHGSVLSSSDPSSVSKPDQPRKKRKAKDLVPDTAPARNTRSLASRQASLDSHRPAAATLPPATVPAQSPTNIPAQPLFTFSSSNISASRWPPVEQVVPPKRPAKAIPKKKAVVKPVAQIHRFLPQEMPGDLRGLRKAMALHLRMLWALLDAKEVPKNPPSELLKQFGLRFTSEDQLFLSQKSRVELIPRHLVQIGTAMSSAKGRIANQARLVEEHMLTYIHGCLARFGLYNWCPDLRESAYSLYNSACRIVALDTFKQALISHAYAHLNPNAAYASDMDILIKLYDHFVFHYMLLRYQKESRHPGSVLKELKVTPQYQGRKRLAENRLKFLKENDYPQRYCDLINAKATSDDERDPSQSKEQYFIKHRPERSREAELFIRMLDARREEQVKQNKSRKWRQRVRIVPPLAEQQESAFHVLPEGMPIDYFDPNFFNNLQPQTRNRVAIRKVALLPDMNQTFTWIADERISDKAFTKKHGATVFAHYNMVSSADMAEVEDLDSDSGDDNDDDEWEGCDDAPTPTRNCDELSIEETQIRRNNLTTHLSEDIVI